MLRLNTGRYGALACLGVALGLLAGCNERTSSSGTGAAPAAVARPVVDPAALARGEALFKKHCAACHGGRAQGALAWERPGPDGKYPAPPLDGGGHDWHHPMAALKQTIRDGTLGIGGNMPAWRATLSDADIDAVIAWFQSLWPNEIYAVWADIDRRARAGEGGR